MFRFTVFDGVEQNILGLKLIADPHRHSNVEFIKVEFSELPDSPSLMELSRIFWA
jgi:hypothetical protein